MNLDSSLPAHLRRQQGEQRDGEFSEDRANEINDPFRVIRLTRFIFPQRRARLSRRRHFGGELGGGGSVLTTGDLELLQSLLSNLPDNSRNEKAVAILNYDVKSTMEPNSGLKFACNCMTESVFKQQDEARQGAEPEPDQQHRRLAREALHGAGEEEPGEGAEPGDGREQRAREPRQEEIEKIESRGAFQFNSTNHAVSLN